MDLSPVLSSDATGNSFKHRYKNSFSTTQTTPPSPFTDDRRGSATNLLYDPPWDSQCVLSFDGGGIRGYSSLIIMRRLMQIVVQIETRPGDSECADTSYAPEPFIPCVDNSSSATSNLNGSSSSHQSGCSGGSSCGECCRFLPCHYFDYIGGTSTGGLISIMLGRLRMCIDSCIAEYRTLSGDIFGHPRLAHYRSPIFWPREKYNGRSIERAVEKVVSRRMLKTERQVGAGNFNSPPGLCRTVVFAYAQKISNEITEYGSTEEGVLTGDAEDSSPYLFRSYDHWGFDPPLITERNPGPAHSLPIWQVARATTAAPFYFDTIEISNRKFGDGGFGTNNPALEMWHEVTGMSGNDPNSIKLLVSMGTGKSTISRFEKGTFKKALGYINAARKLASDSEEAHKTLEQMKEKWHIPYHRFNVPVTFGLGEVKLDEFKHDTLEKIERDTKKYCSTIEKELTDVAKVLVENRRHRTKSDLWPLVSTGKQYRCTVPKCHRTQELLQRVKDIRSHLETHDLSGSELDIDGLIKQGTRPSVSRHRSSAG